MFTRNWFDESRVHQNQRVHPLGTIDIWPKCHDGRLSSSCWDTSVLTKERRDFIKEYFISKLMLHKVTFLLFLIRLVSFRLLLCSFLSPHFLTKEGGSQELTCVLTNVLDALCGFERFSIQEKETHSTLWPSSTVARQHWLIAHDEWPQFSRDSLS